MLFLFSNVQTFWTKVLNKQKKKKKNNIEFLKHTDSGSFNGSFLKTIFDKVEYSFYEFDEFKTIYHAEKHCSMNNSTLTDFLAYNMKVFYKILSLIYFFDNSILDLIHITIIFS